MSETVVLDGEMRLHNVIDGEPQAWVGESANLPLNVTKNGLYEAPEGHAYTPVNVAVPMWWIAEEWEKQFNCWNEKISFHDLGFDDWTPTNTATTLRAPFETDPFTVDISEDDYVIVWTAVSDVKLKPDAVLANLPIRVIGNWASFVFRRPINYSQLIDKAYGSVSASNMTHFGIGAYYSSTGIVQLATTYSVGVYASASSMGVTGTITSATIRPQVPRIYAQTSAQMAAGSVQYIDSEKSTVSIIGEVYKAKRNALTQITEYLVNKYNEVTE